MMLIVSPSALSVMIEQRIDSGIETAMMSVLRQLPRKTRIMNAVRHAATMASRSTPLMAARTNSDWSFCSLICRPSGSVGIIFAIVVLSRLITSSVDALPVFIATISTPRWPSTRAMLVCGGDPLRTCATSWM